MCVQHQRKTTPVTRVREIPGFALHTAVLFCAVGRAAIRQGPCLFKGIPRTFVGRGLSLESFYAAVCVWVCVAFLCDCWSAIPNVFHIAFMPTQVS